MIQIAAPLVIGNMLQQLYNAVDAVIIDRYLGADAFSAAGVGGTVMNLFIFVLSGCCTGAAVILSHMYGRKDFASYRKEAFTAACCGLAFSLILALGGLLLMGPLLRAMNTPDEILPYTMTYLRVILIALPITLLYNLFAAYLRAASDTRAALGVLAAAIMVNMGLDILFVGVWKWGIQGAAVATAIAQLFSVVLCVMYMRWAKPELLFGRKDICLDWALVHKTVSFGLTSALHQSSIYIGKLLVMGTVNSLGPISINAYTAATRIEGFLNSFGDGGAAAASVLIGQRYGAGDREGVREVQRYSLRLHICFGIGLSILLFIVARPAISLMLTSGDMAAREEAIRYLHWMCLFFVLNFIGFSYVGYFRGVGYLRAPTIGSTLHISIRVIISYFLAPKFGLVSVAFATGIGWIGVVIYHSTTYLRINGRVEKEMLKESGACS